MKKIIEYNKMIGKQISKIEEDGFEIRIYFRDNTYCDIVGGSYDGLIKICEFDGETDDMVEFNTYCGTEEQNKLKNNSSLDNTFSFDDIEVWGSNSGATGIVYNVPYKGCESVHLRHKPTGKTGFVKLNEY